jgi:hypothetical protein
LDGLATFKGAAIGTAGVRGGVRSGGGRIWECVSKLLHLCPKFVLELCVGLLEFCPKLRGFRADIGILKSSHAMLKVLKVALKGLSNLKNLVDGKLEGFDGGRHGSGGWRGNLQN